MRPSTLFDFLLKNKIGVPFQDLKNWNQRDFLSPSPHVIKQKCLLRNSTPGVTWIETGTFMGDTTDVLAKNANFVYSIEPEKDLFKKAKLRFLNVKNVEIINAGSEEAFPDLLKKVSGDVNFWLDGHYSGGITFQGKIDTPVQAELTEIAANMGHFKKVSVLIDDVRCFNPKIFEYQHYPSIDFLVDWARANDFTWMIEHDIFIAKNY
jgi:hypothetical protein